VFFILSKVLDHAFAPLTWIFVLLLLTVVRPKWTARSKTLCVAFACTLLYVLSTQAVSNRLVRSLEEPFANTYKADSPPYDAVVLLGGLVDSFPSASAHVPAYNDNVERLLVSFELLREGRAKQVILSSGDADGSGVNEADELSKQLVRWGIAHERILIEGKSRNTQENAAFTKELAHQKGIKRVVLVTSAFHMARARGCFNAAGMEADVLPADYKSFDPAQFGNGFQPRANFFHQSTWAIREWAGRAIYRVRGYTSDTVAPSL
jgi:uncharacterized SAM-binding protein YcdF (DUF218 family)